MVRFNVNDFIELLSNHDVKNKLSEMFAESINAIIDTKLMQKIDELSATVTMLRTELISKNATIENIQRENQNLRTVVEKLSAKNEDLLQETKRDNLVFSGISMSFSEAASVVNDVGDTPVTPLSAARKVITVCKEALHIDISECDISSAYFVKPRTTSSRSSPALLIVRFTRRMVRDEILLHRSLLKDYNRRMDTKIFVNEDLIPSRRKLFSDARTAAKAGKLDSAWTSGGLVRVKKLSGEKIIVHSFNILNGIIN
jgi:cell division protein FtsB